MEEITVCSHDVVRDQNGEPITVNNNILIKNKNSGEIISTPISTELSEIFGFRVQEEVQRNLLYNSIEDTSFDTFGSSKKWSHEATEKLLELYKKNYEKLKSSTVKNDAVYKTIAIELEKQNVQYSAVQVKDRLKYLKMRYMKYKDNKQRSGAAPYRFQYAEIMDEVLADKPNVTPVALLDTSATSPLTVPGGNATEVLETNEDNEPPRPPPLRKKRRREDDVERRHQEKMQILNNMQSSLDKLANIIQEKF